MRSFLALLFTLLITSVWAEGPRVFVIEGGTAIGEKPAKRTVRVEANEQGLVTRVTTTSGKPLFTDFELVYGGDQVHFAFDSLGGGGGVKIKAELSWKKTSESTWEITLNQSNDVAASKIGKTIYPAHVAKRTRKIVLQVSAKSYTWTDQIVSSNFSSNDDPVTYTCTPGMTVVRQVRSPNPDGSYREVMDSNSSDSSPITSGRMVYTRARGKVHGRLYWAMEPVEWDGGEDFKDGGSIDTSGDSLNSPAALINVLNYSLLTIPFYQDTWAYFGPTLFGIRIN